MKPSKVKQKTLKTKEQWNKKIIKLAHQVGIEPTYSNYSINVCLEGRWDTDALFGGQRKDRISKSRGARFTVWCASTYALSALILVVPTGNDPEFSQLWVVPLYLKVNIPAQKSEASCFYEDNFGVVRRLTSSPQAFKERGSLRTYNYLSL